MWNNGHIYIYVHIFLDIFHGGRFLFGQMELYIYIMGIWLDTGI
jgi:hypothetical protein